jgi:putative serine protease PepD
MSKNVNRIAAVVTAGALAAGGATAGYLGRGAADETASPTATQTIPRASTAQQAAAQSTLSVSQLYRGVRSGVVEVIAQERAADSPFPGGGSGEATAQGSGFVYDSAGHVITNQHVVDGASSVSVRFASGQTIHAEIVGTDASTDVAVLKVDSPPSSAKSLVLGDSDTVQVGDGVVAIGSPFGLTGTVTSGIVSAVGREIDSPNNYAIEGAIQTDAAINHGNSGGPLFDMHGRVIGVNAQIKSDSGGNDGVGFAIPSSTIRSIATRLIQSGSVRHAYLGVSLDTADSGGAHISTVATGTPAAAAGLRGSDVVTAVDGKTIASSQELRLVIDNHKPGDRIELRVRRAGETQTFTVTLGTRPAA